MKAKNLNMMRRILAWLMLIFFVLLIVNIFIFRVYMAESAVAYGTMVALFFLTKGLARGGTDYEAENGTDGDATGDSDSGDLQDEQQ